MGRGRGFGWSGGGGGAGLGAGRRLGGLSVVRGGFRLGLVIGSPRRVAFFLLFSNTFPVPLISLLSCQYEVWVVPAGLACYRPGILD